MLLGDGMIFAVDLAKPAKDAQEFPEQKTLGDVIYANQTQAPMAEDDWLSLVRAIAMGDQLALHSIYEQTHRIVFTLMVRITNSRETAEELTLDVFHDVWRRASTYDPANGSVVGWIMNQARSRAIDRLRFENRQKRVHTDTDDPRTKSACENPESALQIAEQSRLLRKGLDMLTAEERQAIETAFFSELTYQEVATKLNQPLGTIKSRIRSGLAKLRATRAGTVEGI